MTYDAARARVVLYGGVWCYRGVLGTGVSSGTSNDQAAPCTDTWAFDGSRWTAITGSGPADTEGVISYDATSRRSVLFGWRASNAGVAGSGVQSGTAADSGVVNESVSWTFDGAKWTRLTTAVPPGRRGGVMEYDAAHRTVVLFGGTDRTSDAELGDTWVLMGSRWTQVVGPGPAPRRAASLTFDPAGRRLLLFGGVDDSVGYYHDTWAFNGKRWTRLLK